MKTRLRNAIWIFILALVSFPVGYLALFVKGDRIIRENEVLGMVMGGIAFIIALGLFTLLVYFLAKKVTPEHPAKSALWFYSIMTVILFGVFAFQYPGAARESRRKAFLKQNKEMLCKSFAIVIDKIDGADDLSEEKVNAVCDCIYTQLTYSKPDLTDQLVADTDPGTFADRSPEMQQMIRDCIEIAVK